MRRSPRTPWPVRLSSWLFLAAFVPRGVRGQCGDERLLWHVDAADRLHPLLAFLLLLQQFALAGDVTAVALGQHVLSDRANVLARNDFGPDRGLYRHLELLARNQLFQPGGHLVAISRGPVLVHDGAECVDSLTLQQDVDLDQRRLLLAGFFVIEAGVAASARLQRVEEVEDDLAQRHGVAQLDPLRRQVVHATQFATPGLTELHDGADELAGRDHGGFDDGLVDRANLAFGPVRRGGDDDLGVVFLLHSVDHVG